MKRQEFFTVKHDTSDLSVKLKDYTTPSVVVPLLAVEYLYIGYYKPFRNIFIDFSVLNTVDTTMVFEYYDGTVWLPIPGLVDETDNFKQSGFIYFGRQQDWSSVDVSGDEQYYIRVACAADLTAEMAVNGINVLFSNDQDLIGIRSNIVSKINKGSSWIEKHEAARKLIIQKLRNSGHRKMKVLDGNDPNVLFTGDEKEDTLDIAALSQFDLFEPFELREASKFYALSFIYLDHLSDESDDKWERAGKRHLDRADEAMDVFMLRIDSDDDGVEDSVENEGNTGINLTWA